MPDNAAARCVRRILELVLVGVDQTRERPAEVHLEGVENHPWECPAMAHLEGEGDHTLERPEEPHPEASGDNPSEALEAARLLL